MQIRGNSIGSNLSESKGRKRLFYGWVVAVAGAGVLLFASNFQYTFGVFIKPLVDRFGWTRVAISGSVTGRSIASALASPVVGTLSDRYGPRKIILTGVFLVGLSYLLASRITSLWQLYLFLSVLVGAGMAVLPITIVATVTRWFGSKAAFANGIVMSGFGFAQMILPPVATYLILQYGWGACFVILGIAAWVLASASAYFIKRPPPHMAEQLLAKSAEESNSETGATPAHVENDYTLSAALHTKSLWIMFAITLVAAVCYQMIVVHIVVAAIDTGITPDVAAIILTLSGVTNTLGRLMLGAVASKIGNRLVLSVCLAIQVPALYFLGTAMELPVFYIAAMVHGFAYGGIIPLMPTLAATFFGTKSVGSIFSLINVAYQAGMALGPLLAGFIFDATGNYYMAFLSTAIATAIVFVFSLALTSPGRKSQGD